MLRCYAAEAVPLAGFAMKPVDTSSACALAASRPALCFADDMGPQAMETMRSDCIPCCQKSPVVVLVALLAHSLLHC